MTVTLASLKCVFLLHGIKCSMKHCKNGIGYFNLQSVRSFNPIIYSSMLIYFSCKVIFTSHAQFLILMYIFQYKVHPCHNNYNNAYGQHNVAYRTQKKSPVQCMRRKFNRLNFCHRISVFWLLLLLINCLLPGCFDTHRSPRRQNSFNM